MFVTVDRVFPCPEIREGNSLRWRCDEMLLKVARPVRRWPARTTSLAKLQRPLEMAEFYTEARERCEGVDDEPTPVAGWWSRSSGSGRS